MMKRHKPEPSTPAVDVENLDELLSAIVDFRDDGPLRLTLSESELFLKTDELVFVQNALAENHAISQLEINGELYTLPLNDAFINKFVPLKKLLKKINDFDGNGTLELEISTNRQFFWEAEMELIAEALRQNRRITAIDVKNITMPLSFVNDFVHTFLYSYHLQRLKYPLWQSVLANSQRELSEYYDELPIIVTTFNVTARGTRQRYICFAYGAMLNRLHADANPGARRTDLIRNLPDDILKHLKPFLVTNKKSLDLADLLLA